MRCAASTCPPSTTRTWLSCQLERLAASLALLVGHWHWQVVLATGASDNSDSGAVMVASGGCDLGGSGDVWIATGGSSSSGGLSGAISITTGTTVEIETGAVTIASGPVTTGTTCCLHCQCSGMRRHSPDGSAIKCDRLQVLRLLTLPVCWRLCQWRPYHW